jgi:hypothetical protein
MVLRRLEVLLVAALAAFAACHRKDKNPPSPAEASDLDRLTAYLRHVSELDDDARKAEVATWKLDEATFKATVQPQYASLYPDYAAHFADAVGPLATALGANNAKDSGDLLAKRHYADDPILTPSQFRIRWALPTEYPTAIATRGNQPIDAVFAPMPDNKWGVLANLDGLARARVRALAPACDAYLDRAGRLGRCGETGWAIVDAAVRGDTGKLGHACDLAASACGW